MYRVLFKHYWLQSIRSPGYSKNLIVNIFIGLFALYFLAIFVLLGFALPKLLERMAPGSELTETFNGILIYATLVFLLVRYQFQPLNTLNLDNYQTLPIKRDILVNYLVLKPLLNPLNYITLCFAVPFSMVGVFQSHGISGAIRLLCIILFLIWFNTLMAPLLKRKFNNILVGTLAFFALIAGLALLETTGFFSLFSLSRVVFGFLIETPFAWISIVLLSVLALFLNKHYFSKNFYPENFERKTKTTGVESKRFTFMERFGKIGEIIALEMRLVLRHKRTKSTLYTAIFFLLYGLLFYPNEVYNNNPGWLLFVAIFVTGIGMNLFGQWIINWDGSHFDFLMTRDIDTRTYIRANYYLLLGLSVISFIMTTPYFLFGPQIIMYHLVALLYNVGVNIYVYLFGATFNTSRLELSRRSSMNMQGMSYKNFIVTIPSLGFPVLLVVLFNLFSAAHLALIIISLIGLTGILFQGPLLRLIEQQFLRRKYALCTGFRKKE